jgi:hypothetical protein
VSFTGSAPARASRRDSFMTAMPRSSQGAVNHAGDRRVAVGDHGADGEWRFPQSVIQVKAGAQNVSVVVRSLPLYG